MTGGGSATHPEVSDSGLSSRLHFWKSRPTTRSPDTPYPVLFTLLLNAVTPIAPPADPRAALSTDDSTPEDPPKIGWSAPPTGSPAELADWHAGYHRQMRPVLSAWARMLRRLRGDLPALFDPQCIGLVSSLEQLDETVLLPVPDRLIDFYLRRLLHASARRRSRLHPAGALQRRLPARGGAVQPGRGPLAPGARTTRVGKRLE